ncbi:MAG: LysR substrate-binding domain-containing protein [Syntrophobacteraceae bacterium]|nr:LysR substrate-binding domain-containing protein [Syntrophobacteraceae bacterium]
MDLRQLKYFLEIARVRSFTRAAENLLIAQPAVSIAIKKLEEELELVLFNRQDKKVTLTAEGEIFLRHANRVIDDIKAAELEMEELKGLSRGEVRIGIPPMISAYFFPEIIRDFIKRYPQLRLSVYGEGSGRLQTMIEHGVLDMGVVAGENFPDTLHAGHFLREEIVVCVPTGHRLAKRESVTFSEFIGEPLIFYTEGYYIREQLQETLKELGATPKVVLETNLFSLIKSLVKNGTGISTFLRTALAGESDLAAIPFDPPLYLDLKIAWRKRQYLSRANQAFVDFLLEWGKRGGVGL